VVWQFVSNESCLFPEMPEKAIWTQAVGQPMPTRLDVLEDLERELAARDHAFAQKEAEGGDQKTQPAYLATEPAMLRPLP
jgi:hypothetical protein